MITYNIIKQERPAKDKHNVVDTATIKAEERLKQLTREKLKPLEDKLSNYNIMVEIDLKKVKTKITSPDAPDDVLQEVRQALKKK